MYTVSCLCRPPSHWWISFICYTIIGFDPEEVANGYLNYNPTTTAKNYRIEIDPPTGDTDFLKLTERVFQWVFANVKYLLHVSRRVKYDVTLCVLRVHAVVVRLTFCVNHRRPQCPRHNAHYTWYGQRLCEWNGQRSAQWLKWPKNSMRFGFFQRSALFVPKTPNVMVSLAVQTKLYNL